MYKETISEKFQSKIPFPNSFILNWKQASDLGDSWSNNNHNNKIGLILCFHYFHVTYLKLVALFVQERHSCTA